MVMSFHRLWQVMRSFRRSNSFAIRFLSYRTSQYKLHYYETPTNIKFVMLTDTKSASMRNALHQIYATIYVQYVVKNPLSPLEHPGGLGVNNEMFELTLEQFVVCIFPIRIELARWS
jgi:trafficking protein particle complex subunit 1